MKKCYILLSVPLFLNSYGFSQDIKLPDEKITGEDRSIEKSEIIINLSPPFKVILPEVSAPREEQQGETAVVESSPGEGKMNEGYFSISAGDYSLIQSSLFYRYMAAEDTEYSFLLDGSFKEGYRKNGEEKKTGFSFHRSKQASDRLSIDLEKVYLGLPGQEFNQLALERDSFSLKSSYSFLGKTGFIPSFSQSFYRVDDTEANFLLLNLLVDRLPFRFETSVERQDVFGDFSTNSFSQSVLMEKEGAFIGGGIKIIEGYGTRFLPSLHYPLNENLYLGLSSFYKIPDFFEDIMFINYKELQVYDLAPEEGYRLKVGFIKEEENNRLSFDICQTYHDTLYTWEDEDSSGLLEPHLEECWQTSISVDFKQKFSDNLSVFFMGEKTFMDREIDFYPEEKFDAGIIFSFFSSLSCKLWFSHTGERIFSGETMGSDTILNAELKMLFGKNIEWGIGIYNIADKEYFTVPGYPAEKRSFVSSLKLLF
jgi:hypothetical protein